MVRTTSNLFCIASLVTLSACSKQTAITPETADTLVDEEPSDEGTADDDGSEEDGNEDTPDSDPQDDGDSSETEPPAEEDDPSAEDDDDDEAPEPVTDPMVGEYSGGLTIIINTSFGPDTCSGTASVYVNEDRSLVGTGSCSFGILGAQTPALSGTVAADGTVTATVDLTAFGSGFSLVWDGYQDESELTAGYNGSDTLTGVGSITYDVIIELESEIGSDSSGGESEVSIDDFVDYSERGDDGVSVSSATYRSTDGCDLDYDLYTPDEALTDTLTVIQHGFARSKTEFAELGSHLASRGMPAVTMDLCHSWALDVDINQNAADVVDLVEYLWDGPVVYMGHSNGAMSSLVSASMDDQAVAVLGLDPVERVGGDHTAVASTIGVPVAGIFGEAGACNSWNSGMDAFMAVPGSDLLRTTEADHCDFEAPTGVVCTLACAGSNDLFSDETIRSNILSLGTAFISWHATGDEDAMEWADASGGARAELEDLGAITGL